MHSRWNILWIIAIYYGNITQSRVDSLDGVVDSLGRVVDSLDGIVDSLGSW